jgi:hypothetical protein
MYAQAYLSVHSDLYPDTSSGRRAGSGTADHTAPPSGGAAPLLPPSAPR